MESNNRVRDVRKALGLTLEKFGEPIGLKKSAVSQIENGKNSLTDQVAKSICREFHVSEKWLRTGEGEMFVKQTRDEQIQEFIDDIFSSEPNTFRHRFITALSSMNEDGWTALEHVLDEMMKNVDEENAASSPSSDIDAKVEAYRRELELEAKATEKSSVSQED